MVNQNPSIDSKNQSEEGDANISEEAPVEPVEEEEETVFEETACPVKIKNTSPNDQFVEINIDGNNLEAVRQQVIELAPLMGFEVEKADIVHNNTQEIPENTDISEI